MSLGPTHHTPGGALASLRAGSKLAAIATAARPGLIYGDFRAQTDGDREPIKEDVVFEIELIKQVEVNVDYILMLVAKWRERDPIEAGGPGEHPELQFEAVRALALPDGRGHAFIHGEAGAVLMIRRHLVRDRGMTADQLSATGYWKLRRTDEQWRAEKRDWLRQAEQDLVA